jgi:hypothetical protein
MSRCAARSATVAAVAMGAVLVAGCGTWYTGLQAPTGEVSDAYADALHAHTRKGWRSQGVERVVSATATLQAPAFLEARRAEQARLMGVPLVEAGEIRHDLPLEVPGTAVLLFIEAVEPAWERLDRAESVWHFHLEVDGVRHAPTAIRRVDERDATVQHLFPYVSRFGRAWMLFFPVDHVGAAPVLHMSGAPAQLRLEYDVGGGAAGRR